MTGSVTANYAVSIEGPLAESTAGATRFYLKDLHEDIVGTVNATGQVKAAKLYSPWGEPAAAAGEATALGFQAQPTDADTGYVDMTTRLYDPSTGRFTSRDAFFGDLSLPVSMNQYAYAEGSPVTYWDPSGMRTEWNDVRFSQVKACTPGGGGGWDGKRLRHLKKAGGGSYSRIWARVCGGIGRYAGAISDYPIGGAWSLPATKEPNPVDHYTASIWIYDNDSDSADTTWGENNLPARAPWTTHNIEGISGTSGRTPIRTYTAGDISHKMDEERSGECYAQFRAVIFYNDGRHRGFTETLQAGSYTCTYEVPA